MSHSYRDDQSLNPAVAAHNDDQPSFTQVLQARLSRRNVLAGGAAWMAKASLPLSAASLASLSACATNQGNTLHRSANVYLFTFFNLIRYTCQHSYLIEC